MKIEHRKIFRGPSKILKNISWPPQKPSGPPSDILNVRSLTSSMSKLPRSQSDCFPLQEELKLGCVPKMIPCRFSALSILHTHMTLTDNLDLKNIANIFLKKVKEGV